MEVIVVNDGSPGNIEEIIKSYSDERVRYVAHESNKGLFQARLTGADLARGSYIAFADSDDYVSVDYYRMLTSQDTDITVGKTIRVGKDGKKFIQPFHDMQFSFKKIAGQEMIKDRFFGQHGMCYGWHTIWNKAYKKSLWDKCEPYYHYICQHVVMTEDMAFSVPLMYFAESISAIENDGYFYCDNDNASTDIRSISKERFLKNIEDMKAVFDFGEWFLNKVEAKDRYRADFLEFRKHYARIWRHFGDTNRLLAGYAEETNKDDHFFGSVRINWNDGLEKIKVNIKNSPCKYISFDMFDTLVKRPLYNPDDMYHLMGIHKIRRASEDAARSSCGSFEDVNLDEIYDLLEQIKGPGPTGFGFKEQEIRLETDLVTPRRAAKELYEVAQACGKEIIIISDMYLPRDVIENILQKCGYSGQVFLSSEVRLTKFLSGELFSHALKVLSAKGSDVLHIGDSWDSDITNARIKGMQAIYFPKAKEIFEGQIDDFMLACGDTVDFNKAMDNLAFRTMLGIICNEYFDNPFRTYMPKYNADPYYMGLFPVGIHVTALIKWIFGQGYKTVAYLARDGYLLMKAHESATRHIKGPDSKYVHVSRKSAMPLILQEKSDFYDMPVETANHSCNSLMKELEFCSKDAASEVFHRHKLLPDKHFDGFWEYKRFIDVFLENFYNKEKHEAAAQHAVEYLKNLGQDGLATFDLGYSGRIQAAISTACGKGIPALFVHSDEQRSFELSHRYGFRIHSFYDYTPRMSGLPREHILSSQAGSCIGYDGHGPVFEEASKSPTDVVNIIHQGALDFFDIFWPLYARFPDKLDFKPQEVSLAFEGFLNNFTEADLKVFSASYFEDTVYGGMEKINIAHHIKQMLKSPSTPARNELLLAKVKGYLRRTPWLYRGCRQLYWRARGWK